MSLSGGPRSLKGCKPSLANSQLLTSSGCAGLDHLINGGVPVGSLVAFEDRPFANHCNSFLHVFLAEGMRCGHIVACAAPTEGLLKDFLRKVPSAKSEAKEKLSSNNGADSDSPMKIAFRYENLPKIDPALGRKTANNETSSSSEFDLGKVAEETELSSISSFHPQSLSCITDLVHWIQSAQKSAPADSVFRLCLPEIDSPLWGFADDFHLCRFIYWLRAFVRSTSSIVLLSFVSDLHPSINLHRFRRLCDAYFLLESLDELAKNAMFKEYSAIFRVQKSFTINALKPSLPVDYEFGYRLKRRKIVLERLHLPPALGEGDGTDKAVSPAFQASGSMGSCGAASQRGLDF